MRRESDRMKTCGKIDNVMIAFSQGQFASLPLSAVPKFYLLKIPSTSLKIIIKSD